MMVRYGAIGLAVLLASSGSAAPLYKGEWWGVLGERVPDTCTDEEVGNVYDLLIIVADDKINGEIFEGDTQVTKLTGSVDADGSVTLVGKLSGRPLKLSGKFDNSMARGTWTAADAGEWCAMHD
jgi:hypothetical protein